jgi:hypothetical protein
LRIIREPFRLSYAAHQGVGPTAIPSFRNST